MPLVDERAAAAHLGVSVAFLRADRCRGHVGGHTPGPPWYRVGRAVRYDLADLDQWLATRRVDRSAARGEQSSPVQVGLDEAPSQMPRHELPRVRRALRPTAPRLGSAR